MTTYAFDEPDTGIVETVTDSTPGETDPEEVEYEHPEDEGLPGEETWALAGGAMPPELVADLHHFFTRRKYRVPDFVEQTLSYDLVGNAQPIQLGRDANRYKLQVFTDDGNPTNTPVLVSTDNNNWIGIGPNSLPVEFYGYNNYYLKCAGAATVYLIITTWRKDS